LISSTSENGARAYSVILIRYRMVVRERSYKAHGRFRQYSSSRGDRDKKTTHATRLPVGRQLLQPLGIAELNKDCDCPLFVVVVWRELQFPCTSNA
jgi:hypothetical protein